MGNSWSLFSRSKRPCDTGESTFLRIFLNLSENTQKWLNANSINLLNNPNVKIGNGVHFFGTQQKWQNGLKFFVKNDNSENGHFVNIIGMTAKLEFKGVADLNIPLGYENMQKEKLIIVEHPLDYLACIQSGVKSVICPPDPITTALTKKSLAFLDKIEGRIKETEQVIFAFSASEDSTKIVDELARRIGKEKCSTIKSNQRIRYYVRTKYPHASSSS